MSQPQTVTVQILDKEYPISCPPRQRAELENAARYLDGKMRGIRGSGKVIGAERIAVLAALNIAHELLQSMAAAEAPGEESRERVRELLDKVERVLEGPGSSPRG